MLYWCLFQELKLLVLACAWVSECAMQSMIFSRSYLKSFLSLFNNKWAELQQHPDESAKKLSYHLQSQVSALKHEGNCSSNMFKCILAPRDQLRESQPPLSEAVPLHRPCCGVPTSLASKRTILERDLSLPALLSSRVWGRKALPFITHPSNRGHEISWYFIY